MKKELILTERNAPYNELSRFFTDAAAWFQTPVEWLRNYYSSVLEREVSSKQASYITQAQLALILTIFRLFHHYYYKEYSLLGFSSAFISARRDKNLGIYLVYLKANRRS